MKAFLLAAAMALLMAGCDKSIPSDSFSDANMFSEESMLNYASATADDPDLQSVNGGMHNGPRQGQMIVHLSRYLDLSAEQAETVRQLGEAMFVELTAIRDSVLAGALTREEARPQVQALREQFMDGVRLLLTPIQQDKLDEWLEHRWERGHQRRHRFGG